MSNQGKDLIQGLFEAAINHYSRETIVKTLDFIASLSRTDLTEWTMGMAPEQTARVYRVWEAAQLDQDTVNLRVTRPEI